MTLLQNALIFVGAHWALVLIFMITLKLVRNRYQRGLSKIPGPFLASLTDLWLFYHCWCGKSYKDYELHRKYNSPLLRLGPNTISVSDGTAIKIIYDYKRIFPKSRLYVCQQWTSSTGVVTPHLSSMRDEKLHSLIRRPVSHAYSLSVLLDFEALVDSTTKEFHRQMDNRFCGRDEVCHLDRWLQMYAFDVVGELTFSKRLGFLESGSDVNNMMYHTGRAMNYVGVMGQIAVVDDWLRVKNTLARKLRPAGSVIKWTVQLINEHSSSKDPKHPDFLTRFKMAQEKFPEVVSDYQLQEYANTNISAGSDTTAIGLRAIVHVLLTNPKFFDTVMEEIRVVLADRWGDDKNYPITYAESNKMIFFQALIKECLRFHPPLGQLLPRDVPKGGAEICGRFIPEGTVVGMNAWTVHRDKNIYGEDADEFNPNRWLDPDKTKVQRLENLSFSFGGGSRTCIGRNIALLEMAKFVPELFRRYNVTLVDPKRFKLIPGWLVVQAGLDVTITKKERVQT